MLLFSTKIYLTDNILVDCSMLERFLLKKSQDVKPVTPLKSVQESLTVCDQDQLETWVRELSFPRHFEAQPQANREARDWLVNEFQQLGLNVELQGAYDNVVATPKSKENKPTIVVGAHYDSMPNTPGADDNASAVSAMLGCARAFAEHFPERNVSFVGFNREEDDLLGSFDFVRNIASGKFPEVKEAHIIEMVGFSLSKPGSQRAPAKMPLKLPDTGDFLGVIANGKSREIGREILKSAATYLPDELPVLTLTLPFGMERLNVFSDTLRSDHTPFWKENIPATMWTDTSEFRNPHYHSENDTPDTLNYEYLENVYKLLVASIANRSE